MRIMQQQNYSPKIYNPSFGSTTKFYKTSDGKEIGNFSWTFREDLNWDDFAEFEIENFKNKDKVNIVQFASSDGSEGYTQIISLLENKKNNNVNKFFPIHAYDIDDHIVTKAQSGYLNINDKDLQRFKNHSIPFQKYFARQDKFSELNNQNIKYHQYNINSVIGLTESFKVSNVLTDKIKFQIGDMFEILPSIKDDSNTVILCRNILGYFMDEPNVIKNFINNANDVLKKGSLFVTGSTDTSLTEIEDYMKKNNFLKMMENVFMKT